jgi:hypothetical protein
MRAAIILATAHLALTCPAAAQDVLAADTFLATFTDRCNSVAADPAAAIAAAVADQTGSGATTTDGAITQFNAIIQIPGATFASLYYQRYVMPGDGASFCTLVISLEEPGSPVAMPELVALIDAEAPKILGAPASRHGSDVFSDGQIARMYIWSAGDNVYDPSLSIVQSASNVTLSVQRAATAAN